jgi:hypothetical protein
MRLSWTDDSPTSSGEAAIGTGISAQALSTGAIPIVLISATTSATANLYIMFLPSFFLLSPARGRGWVKGYARRLPLT